MTTENNRVIAKFFGYYQPEMPKDDLFSFEVYASINECRKDYPKDLIIEYTGEDIEDFTFVDEPKYCSSWDWIIPIVHTIMNEYIPQLLAAEKWNNHFRNVLVESLNPDQVAELVVKFIQWWNEVGINE